MNEKKENYHFIDLNKPLVVVLDGKAVTRNHGKYPMIGYKSFTRLIHRIGKRITAGKDCIIYSMLDEISFVFPDPSVVLDEYDDNNEAYFQAMFLQDFLEQLWKYYPGTRFSIFTFSIEKEQSEDYIKERKEMCYSGALFWYAKEFVSKDIYRDMELPELENYLKKKCRGVFKIPDFTEGILD